MQVIIIIKKVLLEVKQLHQGINCLNVFDKLVKLVFL